MNTGFVPTVLRLLLPVHNDIADAWRDLNRPAPVPVGARITFLETSDATDRVLTTTEARTTDVFVALDPMAAWALRRGGVPYVTLEDGYREEDLRAITEPVLERQEAWADWVDARLDDLIPAFARDGFRPARLNLHWFKLAFDSLTIRAWTVDHALRSWQPASVRYVGDQRAGRDAFGPDLTFHGSIYPAIVAMVAASRGIPLGPDTSPGTNAPVSHQPKAGASNMWRRAYRQAKSIAKRTWLELGTSASAPGALVIGDGYDLNPVRRLAQRRGVRVASWAATVRRFEAAAQGVNTSDLEGPLSGAWDHLSDQPQFRLPLRETGVDLFPLLAPRLRYWLTAVVPRYWSVYQAVRHAGPQSLPAAVVVPHVVAPAELAVFSAFRAARVRTFVYQHGGLIGVCDCPSFDVADQSAPEQILTYGAGVSEYLSERSRLRARGLARPVTVGSARCDHLRSSMARTRGRVTTRRRVVIVPGVIAENNRRIDKGNLPDLTEAELQAALVAAARRFPQYEFAFKLFPLAVQVPTPAGRLAEAPGSNCRLDTRTRLPRLMTDASLIVLTMPATALLEAIQTHATLLVLADQRSIEMRPAALAALKKRAHVELTAEAFLARYDQLLRDGTFGPEPDPDRTFSRLYATHDDDGRSAERVLEALLRPGTGPADSR